MTVLFYVDALKNPISFVIGACARHNSQGNESLLTEDEKKYRRYSAKKKRKLTVKCIRLRRHQSALGTYGEILTSLRQIA